MTTESPAAPITGEALLELSEGMKGQSMAAIARAAGYIKLTEKGSRADQEACKNALLKAHGHTFVSGAHRFRSTDSTLRVSAAGVVTVGKAYLSKANAKPGDRFKVEVDNDGSISLLPVSADSVPDTFSAPALSTVNQPVPALAA